MRKRRTVFAAAAVAGAVFVQLAVAQASGTSPEQLLVGALGGGAPTANGNRASVCCGGISCYAGPAQRPLPYYCCWLQGQGGIRSDIVAPCALPSGCYCQPPCVGVCPMNATAAPTG